MFYFIPVTHVGSKQNRTRRLHFLSQKRGYHATSQNINASLFFVCLLTAHNQLTSFSLCYIQLSLNMILIAMVVFYFYSFFFRQYSGQIFSDLTVWLVVDYSPKFIESHIHSNINSPTEHYQVVSSINLQIFQNFKISKFWIFSLFVYKS